MSRLQPGHARRTSKHSGLCPGIQLPPGPRSAWRGHVCCLKVHGRFPHCQLTFLPWHLQGERGSKGVPRSPAHSERDFRAFSLLGAEGKPVGGNEAGELSRTCSESTLGVFQGRWTGLTVCRREWCGEMAAVHQATHAPSPAVCVRAQARLSQKNYIS